ncbi:MAG: hypothetical protein PHI35_05675 [Victivallaceae bacterium]|nr:hypothetical protein [Victivallaceae bacterium]
MGVYCLAGLVFLLTILILLRDIIVEQTVERVGTMATGTKVEIGDFDTDLWSGELILKELQVYNPPGYVAPYAVSMKLVRVKLLPGSLLSDKIVIEQVLVSGLSVNMEIQGDGDTNLGEIQNNVMRFAGAGDTPEPGPQTPEMEKTADASSRQVVIKVMRFEDCSLSASLGLTDSTLDVPLPAFQFNDIGDGKSVGETIAELTSEFMAAIAKALATAGFSAENLKKLGDAVVDGGKAVGDAVVDGGKAAGDAVKSVFDAVFK